MKSTALGAENIIFISEAHEKFYYENISRINHAIESMSKQLAEAQAKLENVERQLETAKAEVTKPFAQEEELAQKLERLATLNALLNMDEKGDEALNMDDEPEEKTKAGRLLDRMSRSPGWKKAFLKRRKNSML